MAEWEDKSFTVFSPNTEADRINICGVVKFVVEGGELFYRKADGYQLR